MAKDGQEVQAGDVIARKPRETSKTKDIVGGLPRVAELFEVRKPKDMGVVSEIDGIVSFGAESKGKRKIVVTARDRRRQGIPHSQGQAHHGCTTATSWRRASCSPRATPSCTTS